MNYKRVSQMSPTQKSVYIALLAAQATIIAILESFIPNIFAFAPGAKLGLSNMITMVAIFTLSRRDAFKVVTMRLLLTTLLTGTLSTFMYSVSGAYLSFLGMLLIRQLGPKRVSFIGISACGGILFNIGQLIVASLMAGSFTVMLYLPVLSLSGLLAGIVVGITANFMMRNIASINKIQSVDAKENTLSLVWYQFTQSK